MNKKYSVSIGSKYQDILGRDYGVDQTLVWVGHSNTNVSQSLRIGNMNKEIRFSGSVDYSTDPTSIHNEVNKMIKHKFFDEEKNILKVEVYNSDFNTILIEKCKIHI